MKTITIILVIIAVTIVVAATFTSMYYGKIIWNSSKTKNELTLPAGAAPQWQIEVTGDFNQEESWTLTQMSKMPLTEVIIKSENATYIGVSLIEFCSQTGILWDAGPLNVINANGETATLSVFQAWNSTYYPYSYSYNVIVLAFVRNGQWITNQNGGPVKLVAPYFSSSYQIGQVKEIQSELWTVSIVGDVANPLVLTGNNVTDFQTQTLRGAFNPGDAPNVTADWTGVPILNLLQTAKASSQATQISVVGIDGYTQNFTLQQVRDGEMMLGLQENGQYLTTSQGGAFRIFAPTPDYKWGQYWVKWVSDIYVS